MSSTQPSTLTPTTRNIKMDTITQAFSAFRDEPFVCDDASMVDTIRNMVDDSFFEPSTPRRDAPTPRSFFGGVDAPPPDVYDFVIDPPAPNNTFSFTPPAQPLTIPVVNSNTIFSDLLNDTPTTNANFSFAPLTTPQTSLVGGTFGIPNKVVHISQGRKKELGEITGSFLASRYNEGYIDFSFPSGNDPKPANNLFLGWRIAKRMKAAGYDDLTIDRAICVMGNRYCLGCANKPDGFAKNGDVIPGTMHCNQCAKFASGTVDDHIDQFLALDFNKWAKNFKRAM